jgi:hypothetical protein
MVAVRGSNGELQVIGGGGWDGMGGCEQECKANKLLPYRVFTLRALVVVLLLQLLPPLLLLLLPLSPCVCKCGCCTCI